MKKHKFLSIFVALLIIALPVMAAFTGLDLDVTLSNLRRELFFDYRQIDKTREKLSSKYEDQHQKMVEIVKKCNDLSLMLYSQKQEYTFDISYALEKVTREYNDFNKNRTPYDRIVAGLDVEIGRYARLIESLRRLPPELEAVEVLPDSLAYHNDMLDAHLMRNESLLQQELMEKVEAVLALNALHDSIALQDSTAVLNTVAVLDTIALQDSTAVLDTITIRDLIAIVDTTAAIEKKNISAFILSESGQMDRDTCLFYATELLKMYAEIREQVMADSIHYSEARLRMEESYQYARDYYGILENKVFVEGQTPWWTILASPGEYWRETWRAMNEKYNFSALEKALTSNDIEYTDEEIVNNNQLMNSARIYWLVIYVLAFFILWGLAALLMLPVYRFVKPIGKRGAKEQKRYLALLLGCILFIILSYESSDDDLVRKGITIMHTFMWLLVAINAALLIRVEPAKLKYSVRIYLPTIFTALFVIACRLLFVPNAFMNFFFPLLLIMLVLWQLAANLRHGPKADRTDMVIGWVSFGITVVATVIGWCGFVFLSLIILVWWYFQLAVILGVASVWSLTLLYKKARLDKKIATHKDKITYLSDSEKEKMLFGATWFYDLIREVLIPVLVLGSIPNCAFSALSIFEFKDLYLTIFEKPFFTQGEVQISLYNILFLAGMFAVFRYANKALHALWQTLAYRSYLRKHDQQTVRTNEVNLSLGNSLITVFVWFVYADLFIVTLHIPTGALGLIAGGLSAGIGLALKDIINNFIYGIQLMGGRLRVGDWIECDGNIGTVTAISYQTTQIRDYGGPIIAFTNTALFNKNFKNLTRGNEYVYTKVTIGVPYNSDVDKIRELLLEASKELLTKDDYGRDVVDPRWGIKVDIADFAESAIVIAMKQSVLVEKRFGYIKKAKQLIYKTFRENGITIPFNQLDIHVINDNKNTENSIENNTESNTDNNTEIILENNTENNIENNTENNTNQ
jgi:small-conductance mechanosensitive channel